MQKNLSLCLILYKIFSTYLKTVGSTNYNQAHCINEDKKLLPLEYYKKTQHPKTRVQR